MFIITKRQSFIIRYVLLSCITPCVPVMMLRMNAREKYNIEVWILFFSCSQRSTNKHRGMPLSLSTYSEMALVLRTAPHHYTRWPMVNDQWPLPLTLYCGIGLSEKVTPGGTNVVTNQGINNGWRPLVLLLHLLCRNPGDLTNLINFTNFTNLTNLTNLANLISFINLTSTWPTWVNGVRLFLTLLNYIKLNQIRLNWSWGKTKEKTTATRMLECFNWTEHSGVQWDQDQRGMMMRCLNCHKFIWEFWLKIQHTHIRKSFSQKLCFFQSDLKTGRPSKIQNFSMEAIALTPTFYFLAVIFHPETTCQFEIREAAGWVKGIQTTYRINVVKSLSAIDVIFLHVFKLIRSHHGPRFL